MSRIISDLAYRCPLVNNSFTYYYPEIMTNSMSRRIIERLKELGISAREASIRTTGKPDFLRPVLAGAVPRADNLAKLADTLDTTPGWLLTGVHGDAVSADVKASIPLISWVSAGRMSFPDITDDTIDHVRFGDLDPAGDWIALRVVGDSMDRISPPESLIFVDRSDKVLVPNACYVIANEAGEATYKRFRSSPMRFEPVSTNVAHEAIYPTREPLIVGRVKKSVLDM